MNIGIFTDTYYPQINGVVTSTRMLEKELNKLGHKVFIFTVADPKAAKAHPRVFRLPSFPFMFLPSHRVAFLYPPKLILSLAKFKLDVIHTQSEFPLGIFGKVVSDFYRIPIVHTYHTMYEDYVHYVANGHLITPKMAQQYSRIFCNRAGVVIAPVEKAKESLLEYGVTRPIVVIPTGLDLERFHPDRYSRGELEALKVELGIDASAPVIVSVCRVAREKSIDVIIKAMPQVLKQLPDAKYLIVGDGPVKAELEELARMLGVEQAVIFAGSRPWDVIGSYYRLGDCFISASTSETQGLTYIEAMAAGVAVVAKCDKSVEGIIVEGETGYYFQNDGDIAGVIYNALTDKETRMRIAKQGFESVQHLSAENFARQVEEAYKDAIGMAAAKKNPIKLPRVIKKAASYIIDLRLDKDRKNN